MSDDVMQRFLSADLSEQQEIAKTEKLPPSLIDDLIASSDRNVLMDVLEYQVLTEVQMIEVLLNDDPDMSEWLLEVKEIPQTMIERCLHEDELKTARGFLVSNLWLSQTQLSYVIDTETDDWNLYSLVEFQALNEQNIRKVLKRQNWGVGVTLDELIIRNQPLPDSLLREYFDSKIDLRELIYYQVLPEDLILRMFKDRGFAEFYYDLAHYQDFSDDVLEFIKHWDRKSFWLTLVLIQTLSFEHILWFLETGDERIIAPMLSSQNFNQDERSELRRLYPEYVKFLPPNNNIHNELNSSSNRRLLRNGRLKRKLERIKGEL